MTTHEDHDDDVSACPICGSPADDEPCSHLLGVFDPSGDGEGELGAGLEGGDLYGARWLGELLETVQLGCARSRFDSKSPAWLGDAVEDQVLGPYATYLLTVDWQGAPQSSSDAMDDFPGSLHGHGDAVRALLRTVLEGESARLLVSARTIDHMPRCSTTDEYWYVEEALRFAGVVDRWARHWVNAFDSA